MNYLFYVFLKLYLVNNLTAPATQQSTTASNTFTLQVCFYSHSQVNFFVQLAFFAELLRECQPLSKDRPHHIDTTPTPHHIPFLRP